MRQLLAAVAPGHRADQGRRRCRRAAACRRRPAPAATSPGTVTVAVRLDGSRCPCRTRTAVRPVPSTTILPKLPTSAAASFAPTTRAAWLLVLLGAACRLSSSPQAVRAARPSTDDADEDAQTLHDSLPHGWPFYTTHTDGRADRFKPRRVIVVVMSTGDPGRGPAGADRDRRAGQRRLRRRLRHGRVRRRLGPAVPRPGPDPVLERQRADRQARHLLRTTGCRTPGNPLTILTQVGGDGYNGPSHFTFDVQGDQIASMTITA